MKLYPVLLLTCLTLSACSEGFGKMRRDIDSLDQSVTDMRTFQAEQTSQIEGLRSEVHNLTGRLDLIEHSQTNKVIGSDLTNLKDEVSTLKRRVPPPAIVPASTLEVDEVLAASMPEDIGKLFSDALQKLREGQFENSLPILKSALDASYGKDWSANILFWIGVADDGANDNRNALAAYNEIVTHFPKHERAPLALYREANVFVRLGDKKTAKLTLSKLLADYPKSIEASQAKERIKNL